MQWLLSQSWLWVIFALVALMWPHRAAAQLAPTGGHYAGRTSDTGHEPGTVNSSGGYGASVPLDLPAARGGLPVPLQITFGARGVGAAGVGWDVPLSYVRRDTSFAGRRPAFRPDEVPQGCGQVLLALQGRTLDMVRKEQEWVARSNAPMVVLREQNGTWVLFDGHGRRYLFVAPPWLAGTGVWLLQSVSGPGGNTVQLEYEFTTPALTGGSSVSVDLVRLAYNTHPNTACAKHEIRLLYGATGTSPLSLAILGDRVLARMRTLNAVDVLSRASCGGPAERLRRYELGYLPDADTQQPRLRSVQMFGRQGTTEENTPIVVASYGYGAASRDGQLRYRKTQSIALPAGVDTAAIASTAREPIDVPTPGIGYTSWQSLTGVTGDGRPDIVFPKNGKLSVALNRPGSGGTTTLGAGQDVAQLSDATFATGPFEVRVATNNRFTYGANNRNVDEVWRQAIDVNGDGYPDVVFNSSPVDLVSTGGPTFPGHINQTDDAPLVFKVQPLQGSANNVDGVLNADGSPSCVIRGHGPQPLTTVTDEITERYPTCFSRSFAGHQETLTLQGSASLLATSPQAGVTKLATLTAVGRILSRSTSRNGTRLEHATFTHNRVGQVTGMTRFQEPAGATNPVHSSWQLDSLGQLLELHEPEAAPQFSRYSNWGELLEVRWTDFTTSPALDRRLISTYDALGRLTRHEERNNGVTDPETVNEYVYDQAVSVTPLVTPTHVLGRLARAKASTGEIFFSYDAFGQVDARTFTDTDGDTYVEKTTFHADGAPSALEFHLPDTGHKRERVEYSYDSARRVRSMKFLEGSESRQLYDALEIDPFGRVRKAKYGGTVDYAAIYADSGRRLMKEVTVSSAFGSRRILYLSYDPLGREQVRREIQDGAATGPKTNIGYDTLGRLSSALRTNDTMILFSRHFTYDALGNVLAQGDALGEADATLSYRTVDRDRVCRVGYGNGGLGGTACNVVYDAVGNLVQQPTRVGQRQLSYFASGAIRTITEQAVQARFRYDAFGGVQDLDIQGNGVTDTRRDRRYGGLIERREQMVGGSAMSFISRQIPGPGGIIASRRGSADEWIFHFGESRGNRFFTNATGAFVQELDYQPYGETKSSGALPNSAQYTRSQWNGGDALAVFGLSHLGARLYDPVIGRFLSRDPFLVPRTAATTNPYAFAMNDPVNLSDSSGLDWCIGKECQGPFGTGIPWGGPSDINPPGLYFPPNPTPFGADPQAAYRPPIPTTFWSAPKGSQTTAGRALKEAVEEEIDFEIGDNFNFDTLAAKGLSLEAVLERIENTPEAQRDRDAYNARLNSIGSFFAGFGDTVWFWCPGCASYTRQSFGIESGDADQWSYGVGSFTGIVFGLLAPPKLGPNNVVHTGGDGLPQGQREDWQKFLQDIKQVKAFRGCLTKRPGEFWSNLVQVREAYQFLQIGFPGVVVMPS